LKKQRTRDTSHRWRESLHGPETMESIVEHRGTFADTQIGGPLDYAVEKMLRICKAPDVLEPFERNIVLLVAQGVPLNEIARFLEAETTRVGVQEAFHRAKEKMAKAALAEDVEDVTCGICGDASITLRRGICAQCQTIQDAEGDVPAPMDKIERRSKAFSLFERGVLNRYEAMQAIGLSQSGFYLALSRYKRDGIGGLRHGLAGKRGNRWGKRAHQPG